MNRIAVYPLLILIASLVSSCRHHDQPSADSTTGQEYVANRIDSLLSTAFDTLTLDQKLAAIDSLEQSEVISPIRGDKERGGIYYELGKPRFEEYYYKRALEHEVKTEEDRYYRYLAAAALGGVYMMKSDYDGALRLGLSIIDEMKQTHEGTDFVMQKIYNIIGSAQLSMGRESEAEASFEQAYDYGMRMIEGHASSSDFETMTNDVCNIAIYYLNAHRYSEVPLWLNRVEELTDRYSRLEGADADYVDDLRGRVYLYRAVVLEYGHCQAEAAQAYNDCLKTKFGQSLDGLYDATLLSCVRCLHLW